MNKYKLTIHINYPNNEEAEDKLATEFGFADLLAEIDDQISNNPDATSFMFTVVPLQSAQSEK